MITFYTSFEFSRKLRAAGMKQSSLHYYHVRRHEVHHVNDIPKIRDFGKFYTSAFVDPELDQYLPDGVSLVKRAGEWIAQYKLTATSPHTTSANAKAALLLSLIKKGTVTL